MDIILGCNLKREILSSYYRCSFSEDIMYYRLFLSSCPCVCQLSWYVLVDVDFIRDRAAILGDKIKGTAYIT